MNTKRYHNLIFPFVVLIINLGLLFTLLLVFQSGLAAPQTTITVNSIADVDGGSDCTLRNAIKAAQNNSVYGGCPAGSSSGTDVIELSTGETYSISTANSGENAFPMISSAITINGNGATIRRHESITPLRLFLLSTGGALNLNDLTISHFNGSGAGGAISGSSGSITINECTFFNNSTTSYGGAISINSGVTKIYDSTFFDNYSGNLGGAIANWGTIYITNTTFYSNSSNSMGGAIGNGQNWITITNSTFSANISNPLNGNTITNFSGGSAPKTVVRNTIFNSSGMNCYNVLGSGGAFIDGGGNLEYPSNSACPGTVVDPLLGAYQNYGGPTSALALLASSPAIDSAQDSVCPATDQRGFNRPIDGDGDGTAHCDIGAYEYPLWFYFPVIMR